MEKGENRVLGRGRFALGSRFFNPQSAIRNPQSPGSSPYPSRPAINSSVMMSTSNPVPPLGT
jgi:hypothetical protein